MKIKELVEKFRLADQSSHLPIHFSRLAEELGRCADSEVPKEQVLDLYLWVKEQFQFMGMAWSSGTPAHDDCLWEDLTDALILVRDVLVKEFGVELPEPRVVSMVTEMVEKGDLVITDGADDGVTYVQPAGDDPFRIKIKITKVPMGRAPERFREFWVGMELPARPGVPCVDVNRATPGRKNYVVPKDRALTLLCERSPEAAKWFEDNFFRSTVFLFGADEAEVVP